jgi:phage major head subunit gpT-like protein
MYDVTYTHAKYTKGFKISEEMYEDDQYRVMNRKPSELALAARRTAEYMAASVFNNAQSTSYLGGDGLPLASTLHVRSDGGSTQSNASASGLVLNEANLEVGMLALENQLDDKGMKIGVEADTLLVPRALNKTAHILVDSDGRPESTDNDLNFYRGLGMKVVAWHYLTSSTRWFLLDSSVHMINWFWRIKPEFKQDNAFDTGMALYKSRMRFSKGFSDWRGVWASAGDAAVYAS